MKTGMNSTVFHVLQTPALPAAALLYGMIFCLALAHFAGLPWVQVATVTFYASLFVWVAWLLWQRRASLGQFGRIDILFVAFALVVLGSLAVTAGETAAAQKYLRYLPFLVIAPYLCGRLMRVSDIALLMRVTLMAGMTMLPLLLLDRFTSAESERVRLPFFGHDHGPLLVGALLAVALIALCVRALDSRNPCARRRLVTHGLIGLTVVVLVWAMARGWLIAGLAGIAVVSLSMRHRAPALRTGLFAFVVGAAALSLMVLPSTGFYSALLTAPVTAGVGQIFGEASCQPFREGVNSVAMRWVLYQEAMAMFLENPVLGVGATRFGDFSCTGPGGYPHSTVLQGFAELGLLGGGLLAGLLVLAAVTFAPPFPTARQEASGAARAFALALFAAFLVADQIYGNYFMSVGMWLMLGMAASMRAHDKQGASHG